MYGIYGKLEAKQPGHRETVAALDRVAGEPLVMSPYALTELRTTRLLTLDERDYRVVRPLWGDAFDVLPADADAVSGP